MYKKRVKEGLSLNKLRIGPFSDIKKNGKFWNMTIFDIIIENNL